ncbi:MAG: serine hydrolase domain-containing protein [Candidatus Thorarchaeota archaeon]|jgi:CubicO group peptidase (beta-lactamase class C family)
MSIVKRSSKLIAFLFLIQLLSLSGAVISQANTEYGDALPPLDADIHDMLTEGNFPSLQVGLVINDSLRWAKGYGDQPNLDTVFMVGSITKTFTGTAFLQLHERGLIDLEADVSDYLDFDVRNPNDPTTVITANLLLSHRAGMAHDFNFTYAWLDAHLLEFINTHFGASYPIYNGLRLPLVEIINSTTIANPDLWLSSSGTSTSYSNSGFFFLSYLLEKITNQTYAEYIEENILVPLGMGNSGFTSAEFGNQNAIPHGTLENQSTIAFPIFESYSYGAWDLRTTVLDLSKFLIAHMNLGRSNDFQLLHPESVSLMHSDSLGWSGTGHGGLAPGFVADMYYYDNENGTFGIIQLINREEVAYNDPAFELSRARILSRLREEGVRILAEEAYVTPPPTTPSVNQTPDLLIIGGLSVGGIVVIAVAVYVLRRRSV